MQLKTFSAKTTAEVLARIKEELGPDAIILESREENGMICMTAARERGADEPEEVFAETDPPARAQESKTRRAGKNDSRRARSAADDALLLQMQSGDGRQWQEEWNSIRGHLLSLMKPALKLEELPPRQRVALDFLQREGVNDAVVLELVSRLKDNPSASILEPLEELVMVQPWQEDSWPQTIHVIAGPFGAGKTTVALRMALKLNQVSPNLKICMINADASRGNGRLLLKHYADLSDFAYKEAASTMDLVAALNSALKEGFDRIIVDLPGLGRGRHLQALLKDAGLDGRADGIGAKAAVHIVLPPHYGENELRGMLERYRTTIPGSIVWTKLDEAEHFGQVVNVSVTSGLPVSAISYGPGLGNSFAPAKEAALWRLIFKKELP